MPDNHRRGLTLVELLVLIAILVFLLALLLPAIRLTKSPGQRNTCSNNMRNLAIAIMNYTSAKGVYPGYLNSLATVPANGESAAGDARVTWVVSALPYLERIDLYNLYRHPGGTPDPRTIYMNVMVCPSSKSGPRPGSPPPCDYVVNTGRADVIALASSDTQDGYPADCEANGVFFNHYYDSSENPSGAPLVLMSQDYIADHDGTSLTIMLSERLDAGSYSYPPVSAAETEAALGFVWWPSTNDKPPYQPPYPSQRINGPHDTLPINNARPSSGHPGGVNVAFCDGHTRYISQDIDYGVWCLLMTPYGRHCNSPGEEELEPASSKNNYLYLRFSEVDESEIQ